MSNPTQLELGSVVSLRRYPVKSMMGEEVNSSGVTERGLLGDRAYAVVDPSDGKVASAKNPRKWPRLFDFRSALMNPPSPAVNVPPVRIMLPDGTIVTSAEANIHEILSRALNREVTLDAAESHRRDAVQSAPAGSKQTKVEEYWPDMEGLDFRDTVTDFVLPEG